MAAFPVFHMSRYPWFDRLVALVIIVGAALSCILCLANGNPAASLGVLLVFGMALIAVAASRSDGLRNVPTPRYRAPETPATPANRPVQRMAPPWGRPRLSC